MRVEHTLFGIMESDAAARVRARKIVRLLGDIEAVPELIECRKNDIRILAYFIRRSKQIRLDLNDLDGLVRLVGDTEELLTDWDRRQMHERKIWRRYPKRYLGARPGSMYPAALHEKEVAYLAELQQECRNEILCARIDRKKFQAELQKLRSVCPLPAKVAAHFSLSPEGYSLKRLRGILGEDNLS